MTYTDLSSSKKLGSPVKETNRNRKTQQRHREEHRPALEGHRTQKSISKFFSKLHTGIVYEFFILQAIMTHGFSLTAAERASMIRATRHHPISW